MFIFFFLFFLLFPFIFFFFFFSFFLGGGVNLILISRFTDGPIRACLHVDTIAIAMAPCTAMFRDCWWYNNNNNNNTNNNK